MVKFPSPIFRYNGIPARIKPIPLPGEMAVPDREHDTGVRGGDRVPRSRPFTSDIGYDHPDSQTLKRPYKGN